MDDLNNVLINTDIEGQTFSLHNLETTRTWNTWTS